MTSDYKDYIVVKGARENNLKNVNVTIPKNALVVFSGVSGSGKSTLAFDTIFAAAVRGEPFLLRPDVSGSDGQAGCGLYRGTFSGYFH